MGNELAKQPSINEQYYVVYNAETEEYEYIDLHSGEVVNSQKLQGELAQYRYTPVLGRLICQEVAKGRPLTRLGESDKFPPFQVIQYWRRMYPDFDEAINLARRDRAEYYHDKVMDSAERLESGVMDKDQVNATKAAIDAYKWGAERNDPDTFGTKRQDSEGGGPSTIVINTGIQRNKPKQTEVIHETDRIRRGPAGGAEAGGTKEEGTGGEEEKGRVREDQSGGPARREQDQDCVGEEGRPDEEVRGREREG